MAKSMTAYGRAFGTVNGRAVQVEIKSVNGRYFDCNVKISRGYGCFEEKAKKHLYSKGISRGKVDLYIGINIIEDSGAEVYPDMVYAGSYINALYRLRDAFGLKDDISVMNVAKNQHVFTEIQTEEDYEGVWNDIVPVFDEAISQFISEREAEGERLSADLTDKKKRIEGITDLLEARSEIYTETYRRKLESRLSSVLEEYNVVADEARVLAECAIFADKTSIDEELVRLRSHFKAYDEIFLTNEPIGRRLDFLLQEINREINTVGSKCNDAESGAMVVDIKCLLEKIREQVQNLE